MQHLSLESVAHGKRDVVAIRAGVLARGTTPVDLVVEPRRECLGDVDVGTDVRLLATFDEVLDGEWRGAAKVPLQDDLRLEAPAKNHVVVLGANDFTQAVGELSGKAARLLRGVQVAGVVAAGLAGAVLLDGGAVTGVADVKAGAVGASAGVGAVHAAAFKLQLTAIRHIQNPSKPKLGDR